MAQARSLLNLFSVSSNLLTLSKGKSHLGAGVFNTFSCVLNLSF